MINTQTQIIPDSIFKCSIKDITYNFENPSPNIQSDITLLLSTNQKNFQANKHLLIPYSEFFQKQIEQEQDLNLLVITKRLEPSAFEKIIKCFYGYHFFITNMSELYYVYEVIQFLKIQSLIQDVNQQIAKNIAHLNFYVVFQLAVIYKQEELLEICQILLNDKKVNFRNLLDINVAPHYLLQNKQHRKNNQLSISKPPYNFFLLSEDVFKHLIKIHNNLLNLNLKTKKIESESNSLMDFFSFFSNSSVEINTNETFDRFLDYLEIFDLIKMYVESKISKKQEQINKLRELVLELIDRNLLTSIQYQKIYHTELLLQNSELPENIQEQVKFSQIFTSFNNQTDKQDIFVYFYNPLISENFFNKKRVEELEREKDFLLKKVFSLETIINQNKNFKMTNYGTVDSLEKTIEKFQTDYKDKFENRVDLLEDQLVELKTEIFMREKDTLMKEQTIQHLQRKLEDSIIQKNKELWESTENESLPEEIWPMNQNKKQSKQLELKKFNSTKQLIFPSNQDLSQINSIESPLKYNNILDDNIKNEITKICNLDVFESIQYIQRFSGSDVNQDNIKPLDNIMIMFKCKQSKDNVYLIRRKNEIGIIKKEEKFKMSEIEMNLLINEIINRKEFNNNGKEEEIEKIVLYELMIGTWMDM